MANVKISSLPSLSSVSDSVIIPVVDSSTTQRITALALKTYIGTYGDSNVAAYLTSQSISSYGDSNVASYLVAHPQPGTYGNLQVIANLQYLTTPVTTTNTVTADKIVATNNGNGTNFKVGDDAWIGDVNVANTMRIAGQEDGTQGYIIFGNTNNSQYIGRSGISPITTTGDFAVTGTSYFANVSIGNIVQGLGAQITTASGTNGNITLNPDGTGWVVVTSITPAWFGNTVTMTNALTVKDVRDTVYDLGTTSGTIAPNGANGDIQTMTLNGALTLNGFTNPVSGQTITLIINQGTGGFAMTSSMKFAGGYKTLSTAANATDIIHISYIGSTYYASLVTGYV